MAGLASTSTLTNLTLSPKSAATSSTIGAIWRQGPHHWAQKSMTTGTSDLRTSSSKVASVTARASDMIVLLERCGWVSQDGRGRRCDVGSADSALC